MAVDTHVANETGEVVTVRQPLPLPEGVPDTALPGSSYAAAAPMPTGARYHTALAEEAPPAGGIRPKEEDVEEVKPVEPEKKAFDFKFGFEAEDLTKIQALEEAVREKVVSVAKRCVSRAGTFKFKVLVNRFGTVTALTIVESPGSEKQDFVHSRFADRDSNGNARFGSRIRHFARNSRDPGEVKISMSSGGCYEKHRTRKLSAADRGPPSTDLSRFPLTGSNRNRKSGPGSNPSLMGYQASLAIEN